MIHHPHWPFHLYHHATPGIPAAPHVQARIASGGTMVTTAGVDYSWGRPAPSASRAAGFHFACRYLDPSTKGVTRAEADALAAEGIWVVCTYETTATWMLGGYSAGQSAARQALALGQAAGMPDGRPVLFAADFDATPGQCAVINDCLDGAASVLGRSATGIYGGLAAVSHAMETGAARWAWQTLAWSGGVWYGGAQIRQTAINGQVGGQPVDYDLAVTADYGQWQPGKLPDPAPAPAPRILEEEPMLLLAQNVAMPVPIPQGTRALRFCAAGTAQVRVDWRGLPADTATWSWDADTAQDVTVPDRAEALVTRLDDGTDAVSLCFTT